MDEIGLIGAGVMGRAVAPKILNGGYGLLVYDVSAFCIEKAKDLGASVASNLAEVAEKTKIILMLLPGPEDVRACVSGEKGLLSTASAGTVIVDMSTIDPATTTEMASLALSKGVGYVDAPVLGRPATVGSWALPAGGRPEDIDRCRPVLSLFAAHILHAGPSGSGHKIKLLNQMMFGAINAMTAEMMAVASHVGIEPKLLYETISASRAGTVSNLFLELGGRIAAGDYENPTFTVDLLVKDVRLAAQMARDHGALPLLGRTVEFMNEMAQVQGFGAEDTAVMWKSVKQMWEKKG